MNINNTAREHFSEASNNPHQNRQSFNYSNISSQPSHTSVAENNTNINERIVAKIAKTRTLTNRFSEETLTKLIDKGFFIEKAFYWRDRECFTFANAETGRTIDAEQYSIIGTYDKQVLSQLALIEEIESKVSKITGLNYNNLSELSADEKLWIARTENTVTRLDNILTNESIGKIVNKGFYLYEISGAPGINEIIYTFTAHDDDSRTFHITTAKGELNRQLTLILSKLARRPTNNANRPIVYVPEQQINSYDYKVIVISKALAKLSLGDRTILMGDANDPYVDSIELFKQLIVEGINSNHDDPSRNSHLELINSTEWQLDEINTIIRKGILLLAD